MSTTGDPLAHEAAENGIPIAYRAGPVMNFEDGYTGRLLAWISLTREGHLVLRTRYRTYSSTSGHSVPTPPLFARFATEAEIRERLAEDGIVMRPVKIAPRTGAPIPEALRPIFAKLLAEWTDDERMLAVAFMLANP